MTLAEKMLTYRAKHRMTQPEFAKKCGLSTQTVCSIETGQQTPSRITELKILLVVEEDKESE